jgi:hypothetical protein
MQPTGSALASVAGSGAFVSFTWARRARAPPVTGEHMEIVVPHLRYHPVEQLHPSIGPAFETIYVALRDTLALAKHIQRNEFAGEGIPEPGGKIRAPWAFTELRAVTGFDRDEKSAMVRARLAIRPVHAPLCAAFNGFSDVTLSRCSWVVATCAHDAAVQIIDWFGGEFLFSGIAEAGDRPDSAPLWEGLRNRLAGSDAVVDGLSIASVMWREAVQAGTTMPAGPVAASGVPISEVADASKLTPDERDKAVRDYLRKRIEAGTSDSVTRDGVAAATGISNGAVSGTPAWKRFASAREAKPPRPGDSHCSEIDEAIRRVDWAAVQSAQEREAERTPRTRRR